MKPMDKIEITTFVEDLANYLEKSNETLEGGCEVVVEDGYADVISRSGLYLICDGETHSFSKREIGGELFYELDDSEEEFLVTFNVKSRSLPPLRWGDECSA